MAFRILAVVWLDHILDVLSFDSKFVKRPTSDACKRVYTDLAFDRIEFDADLIDVADRHLEAVSALSPHVPVEALRRLASVRSLNPSTSQSGRRTVRRVQSLLARSVVVELTSCQFDHFV